MSFTSPIWLWGLTGLIVPIGIHLLSLKEGKTVYIGSLRHLRESNTAQFSSIRLNELMLLLIRSLLIILLVLFLAGFQLNVTNDSSEKWVVIDKGVVNDPTTKGLIDSLRRDGYEIHLLTKGSPMVDDSANADWRKNNWTIARDLVDQKLEDVIVISNNLAKDFSGMREEKTENIRWISTEPVEIRNKIKSLQLSTDSVWIREATSSAMLTKLDSRIDRGQGSDPIKKIRIALYADDEFDYDKKVLFASMRAIDKAIPFEFSFTEKFDGGALNNVDWVIWLSKDPIHFKHANIITMSPCNGTDAPLLQRGIETNLYCENVADTWWIITKRLTEDVALDENLSVRLASIILDDQYDETVSGQRTLNEASLWSVKNDKVKINNDQKAGSAIDSILMFLCALTMIAERLIARNRNQ